jgi:hypothetical protein
MGIPSTVLDWLLETSDPSVRYRTLTELLALPAQDAEVRRAYQAIPGSAPVQKIFAAMHPEGYWLHRGKGAGLEYAAPHTTHFVLAYLAELDIHRADPRVANAVERYLALNEPDVPNPAIWQYPPDYRGHQSCLYAYNLRTFLRLGYRDDARIQERIHVLLTDWRADGGYLCDRPSFNSRTKSCIRGAVKALAAFAELPEHWQSERCLALVDYFLRRQLIYKSRRPGEIIRSEVVSLSYPFVYNASLLEPLLALSRMGYGHHPALEDAWAILESKKDAQDRQIIDRARKTLFVVGSDGQPNKWITFYAYLARKLADRI